MIVCVGHISCTTFFFFNALCPEDIGIKVSTGLLMLLLVLRV